MERATEREMETEMEVEIERVHHLHLISSSPPSQSPCCVTSSGVVMFVFHRILMTTNAMESPLEGRHILATTHRTCSVILGAAGSMPPGNKSMLRASAGLSRALPSPAGAQKTDGDRAHWRLCGGYKIVYQ